MITLEESRRVSAHIASVISAASPYVDYTPGDVERWYRGADSEELGIWRDLGMLGEDPELFYVVRRFCEGLGLWNSVDYSYLRTLFRAARKYTPEIFYGDPYLKTVQVPEARIGNYLLTSSEYARGEFFQYAMPDPRAEITVPKIAFCTQPVRFPAIYEGNMPWMSVCPSEISSMEDAVERAHGNVLVLGLGLGYYPFRILPLDRVRTVTVVERQEEILRLFELHLLPQFPAREKLRVVRDDAYRFLRETRHGAYDFCFADIWEGPIDGAEAYRKLQPFARALPETEFSYWIEDVIREDD